MAEVTQYELAILDLVLKGEGRWGWYQIETRLSRMDVPRVPNAIQVLKDLAARGLVVRHIEPGAANDRWELTPRGVSFVEQSGVGSNT